MNRIVSRGILDGIFLDHVIRDSRFNMPTKHFHNEYEIYYLLDGSRYYFIENQTYIVNKGSLVIVDSQQIHKTSTFGNSYHDRILLEINENPTTSYIHGLNNMSLHRFFQEYAGIIELTPSQQRAIESLLFTMIDEFEHRHVNYENMILSKLNELLITISRYKEVNDVLTPIDSPSTKYTKVNEVADYITQHYASPLSLHDLAEHFYINKSYLSRVYKEITGFTVNEYINITRIKRAQHLLLNTDDSIHCIALGLGYESVSYFERVFKKYTETTPLRYRKKNLEIQHRIREKKSE